MTTLTCFKFKTPAPAPRKPIVKKAPAAESCSILKSDKSTESTEQPPLPASGHYELNTIMKKALTTELQNIMIKVWQELPDEPPTEAEKLIVKKFRNDIGDDFRNVLGLNVTKRLLNIHNQLFVKAYFSKEPRSSNLKAFIDHYNCAKVKRIASRRVTDYTLAIQLSNVADFDRLCNAKNVRCGDAKVAVTPCYKFTHCPINIKTIYNETTDPSSNSASENVKQEEKAKTLIEIVKGPQINVNAIKANKIGETSTSKVQPKKNIVTPKAPTVKTVKSTPEVKTNVAKEEPKKSDTTSKIDTKVTVTPPKTSDTASKIDTKPPKTSDTASKIDTKVTVTPTQVKNNAANVEPKENPTSKVTTPTKGQPAKIIPDVKAKIVKEDPKGNTPVPKTTPNVGKEAPTTLAQNATDVKKNPVVKSNVKISLEKATNEKAPTITEVTPVNTSKVKTNTEIKKPTAVSTVKSDLQVKKDTSVPVVQSAKVKPAVVKTVKKVKVIDDYYENSDEMCADDDDVLDDEDILALMKQAIVLDECSGSDDE